MVSFCIAFIKGSIFQASVFLFCCFRIPFPLFTIVSSYHSFSFYSFIYLAVSGLSRCLQAPGHEGCIAALQAWLLQGMWDLSSLTRDRTCIPCIARWILNHWDHQGCPGAILCVGFRWVIHVTFTTSRRDVIIPILQLGKLKHKKKSSELPTITQLRSNIRAPCGRSDGVGVGADGQEEPMKHIQPVNHRFLKWTEICLLPTALLGPN